MRIRKVIPPFRAGHVGSLFFTDTIRKARSQGVSGAALREIEDREIRQLIRMQENIGFKTVTDGEIRRRDWPHDFLGMLINYQYGGNGCHSLPPRITGKLDFPADHPVLDDFRFLAQHTHMVPKVAIPGPSCVHYGIRPENISYRPYKEDPEYLFQAIAGVYRKLVRAFYAAGCRYLQLDDIYFSCLSDPRARAERRAMGQDPDDLINRYAWMLEDAIKDRPADMVIAMHMCRGACSNAFVAAGSYDMVADVLFNQTSVDIYYLEYNIPRTTTLMPLRLLPRGKRVMAGLISTRTPELETVDEICTRLELAMQFTDPDQLGICPQCGFASGEYDHLLTDDDQRRKLELVVKVAEKVWGRP